MASKRDIKSALRATLDGALTAIDSAVASIDDVTVKYLRTVGVFEVQAGMGLDVVRSALAEAKEAKVSFAKTAGIRSDDWREVARTKVPGKDVKTLYRWQNAGAVARVRGDDVGNALVGSLVPLYRILSALPKTATAEDRSAAEDLVRTAWAEALTEAGTDDDGMQIPPEFDNVKAIAERLSPTTRSGGASTTTDDATEDDDDDDSEEEDDDGAETRRESSDSLVVVEAAAVEAAAGPVEAIMRGTFRPMIGKPLTSEGVKAIMLATLRLASEHGAGTIVAVLAGKAPETAPETTTEEAPEETPSES